MRGARHAMAVLLLALAVACTSEESARSPTIASSSTTAPTTTSTAVATTTAGASSSVPAGAVTLRANDVRLVNSEESDNAFRALFDSAASEVTVVLSGVPSPNRVVFVCPAAELERRVAAAGCVTPGDGEPVKVAHGGERRGVEVVQVGVAGTGPAANSIAVRQIAVTYVPTSRELRLRLPPLRQGEAGGVPSFTLSPPGPGTYRATATWTATGGTGTGTAELTVMVGSNVNRSEGPPGAQTQGSVSPPAEGTVRIRNTGSATLTALTVTVLFP